MLAKNKKIPQVVFSVSVSGSYIFSLQNSLVMIKSFGNEKKG